MTKNNTRNVTIEEIDACLPQTQCTRCGYPNCRLYAEAIAKNEADINQCPPGGDVTIEQLSALLGVPQKPLNESVHGQHKPRFEAKIIEDLCIGCTVCIKACPVDAIIGAHKSMHVIIGDECTGCELCIPPCPMDCIEMVDAKTPTIPSSEDRTNDSPWAKYGYTKIQTDYARERHQSREARLSRTSVKKSQQINGRKLSHEDRNNTIMDILKRKL